MTSLAVTADTVVEIAACARVRWKIENESFNVLKSNGDHLEHNFGHGQQNRAMIFAALNLLAFAVHTVCDCLDRNHGWWMMNGPTIGKVRLLKDAVGRSLWQDGLTEGGPPMLLGRPMVGAADMPDLAANAAPIVLGDFGSAYRTHDRVGLSVLRDPCSIAVWGSTRPRTRNSRKRRRAAESMARLPRG